MLPGRDAPVGIGVGASTSLRLVIVIIRVHIHVFSVGLLSFPGAQLGISVHRPKRDLEDVFTVGILYLHGEITAGIYLCQSEIEPRFGIF